MNCMSFLISHQTFNVDLSPFYKWGIWLKKKKSDLRGVKSGFESGPDFDSEVRIFPMFSPCFPVLVLSRWPYPLYNKNFKQVLSHLTVYKSQAKNLFSKANFPSQFLNPGTLDFQLLTIIRSLIALSTKLSSGHKRCTLSCCPLKWLLSPFPFLSPSHLYDPKCL